VLISTLMYCKFRKLVFFFLGATAPIWDLAYLPLNSPFHFSFTDLRQSVGLLGRVISSAQVLCGARGSVVG
jgi:hypothetical protein